MSSIKTICGADCDHCDYGKQLKCKGCESTNGCPFGKDCFIAKYIKLDGKDNYEKFKEELIKEFNELKIAGMPQIKELYALNGGFVNLEYILPNGNYVKFLNDNEIYLGNQVECEFTDGEIKRCFGIVANMNFLLVCEYGENGDNPKLIIYKKR